MKRQQLKMWSFIAAATLFACTLSAPVYAEDAENLISISADNLSDAPVEEMTIDNVNLKPNDSYYDVYELEMERIENTRPIDGLTLEELQESGNIENLSLEDLLADLGAGSSNIQGIVEGDSAVFDIQTFSVGTDFPEERYTIYDAAGRATAGWMEENGNWYYEKADGSRASGWLLIDGMWYYFETDPTHYMRHGWFLSENKYYFMGTPGSPSTGAMYTYGWMNDTEGGGTSADPLWYYMGSDGVMHHGWLQDGGNWYHMGYPGSPLTGTMYNFGWMEDTNGSWYYFEDDGIMQTGWLYLDQKYYYLNESSTNIGQMAIGSKVINDKTYLFDSLGVCINRNPPSTNNNMTYNFTFYLETEKDPILGAKNDILLYFDLMEYPNKQIATGEPRDTYAQWPYDKVTIIHGHGIPGHTEYIREYKNDDEDDDVVDSNWLISSRNWTYTGKKNEPAYTTHERVISDYTANQLSNNDFTLFISCFSGSHKHTFYTKDQITGEITITGTRTVDRSSVEATYDAGANCVMGYQYTVQNGEFYAKELASAFFLGYSIEDAIDYANYEYGKENPCRETTDELGEMTYPSPHDVRNQVVVGDTSIKIHPIIYPLPPDNDLALSKDSYVQNQNRTEITYTESQLATQISSKYNLISGPDVTINYKTSIRNGVEYCMDDEGRIVSIYTNQTKSQNSNQKLSSNLLEQNAREFLAANNIAIENYEVTVAAPSTVGHQFTFKDEQGNMICISMYDNGVASWANIYYSDKFNVDVAESDQNYFSELFQNEISENGTSDEISNYSVSYRKLNDTLYAVYDVTYRDSNGMVYCEEMVFGK